MYLAAAIQLNASSDVDATWKQTHDLVSRAARYGAALVCTPECTNYLGPHDQKVATAQPLTGSTVQRYQDLARRLNIHLLIGSVNEKSEQPDRCYNTSVLIGPDGDRLGHYRKMHLFDVDVPGGVTFCESDTTVPGDEPVVVQTELGGIGLSICYDLRFPRMYQALTDAGAEVLAVPSAFTLATGKDHWHPLLRARAIETQCYVIAPGQHGHHDDKGLRDSYGHSMVVDPWGAIVGMSSDGPGIALAEVDLDRVRSIRRRMPVREHRRL